MEFSDYILANLIGDPEYAAIVMPKIKSAYMTKSTTHDPSTEHRMALTIIEAVYKKYSKVPSVDGIRSVFTRNIDLRKKSKDINETFPALLDRIREIKSTDALGFKLAQTENHFRSVGSTLLIKGIDDINNKIDSGDRTVSRSHYKELVSKFDDIRLISDNGSSAKESVDEVLDEIVDESRIVSCGIKSLDALLDKGGVRTKSIIGIGGIMKIGKSTVCRHIASTLNKSGGHGMAFVFEDDIHSAKSYYYKSMIGKTDDDIIKMGKTKASKLIQKELNRSGDMQFYAGKKLSLTISGIRDRVERVNAQIGSKINFLIIDNLRDLKSSSKSSNETYDFVQKAIELRELIEDLDLDMIYITLHANPKKCADVTRPEAHELYMAGDIGSELDYLLMMGSDPQMKIQDQVAFHWALHRHSGASGESTLTMDYPRQRVIESKTPSSRRKASKGFDLSEYTSNDDDIHNL